MPIFERKEEAKVPLNNDVMMKCICQACPVQTKSACTRPKIKKMMDMKASMQGSQMPSSGMGMSAALGQMAPMKPKPEEMPGPYCSIGVAACKDLNSGKSCICPQCQVYMDYSLKATRPVEHFCFNGNAV